MYKGGACDQDIKEINKLKRWMDQMKRFRIQIIWISQEEASFIYDCRV